MKNIMTNYNNNTKTAAHLLSAAVKRKKLLNVSDKNQRAAFEDQNHFL